MDFSSTGSVLFRLEIVLKLWAYTYTDIYSSAILYQIWNNFL